MVLPRSKLRHGKEEKTETSQVRFEAQEGHVGLKKAPLRCLLSSSLARSF